MVIIREITRFQSLNKHTLDRRHAREDQMNYKTDLPDNVTEVFNDGTQAYYKVKMDFDNVFIDELDSNGQPASYNAGDRVLVLPLNLEATVIRQVLHHDCGESFWGNLELQYDDGQTGRSNSWQCKRIS